MQKYMQNNTGFFNWLATGKPSFTLEKSSEPLKEFKPNTWASLLKLSRDQQRTPLGREEFQFMFGPPNDLKNMITLIRGRIAFFFRYITLGFIQLLDTLVYATPMFFAGLQLIAESFYQTTGRALGFFGETRVTNNPVLLIIIGIAFIFSGIAATLFRASVFLTKSFADGLGLLLNIANIVPAVTSGLFTSALKLFFDKKDTTAFDSYARIWRAVWADIVYPFSAETGKILLNNLMNDKLPQNPNLSYKPIPMPSPATMFGYIMGAAAVLFFTFTTGGLGFISKPLIPWIGQFIGGLFSGGTVAAGMVATSAAATVTATIIATNTTIGVGLFGTISSFFDRTAKATLDIAKSITYTAQQQGSMIPDPSSPAISEFVSTKTLTSAATEEQKKQFEKKQEQHSIEQPSQSNSQASSKDSGADTYGYYGPIEERKNPDLSTIKVLPVDTSSEKGDDENEDDDNGHRLR